MPEESETVESGNQSPTEEAETYDQRMERKVREWAKTRREADEKKKERVKT